MLHIADWASPAEARGATGNHTTVTEFILLGLSEACELQMLLFLGLLLTYLLTLLGNLLIVVLTLMDRRLHTPMYYFLRNFAVLEIWFTSVIFPKMLTNKKTISYAGCVAQLITFLALGATECLLLAVMSFDRYVAICNPLRYVTTMSKRVCVQLVLSSWITGFLLNIIPGFLTFHQPFCGPNIIDHFMCDMFPLLKLVCTDTFVIGILVLANGGLMCTLFFLLLLVSYGVILHSLKNLSQEGRRKALQTCGSHITVVVCFFVPCIFMYVRPAKTFPVDKLLSMFFTVITPILNPLIYSLRSSELTHAMKKLWRRNIISHIK